MFRGDGAYFVMRPTKRGSLSYRNSNFDWNTYSSVMSGFELEFIT